MLIAGFTCRAGLSRLAFRRFARILFGIYSGMHDFTNDCGTVFAPKWAKDCHAAGIGHGSNPPAI